MSKILPIDSIPSFELIASIVIQQFAEHAPTVEAPLAMDVLLIHSADKGVSQALL